MALTESKLSLTSKQQEALECIQKGISVFITGPGGTGKSTLIRETIRMFSSQKGDARLRKDVGNTSLTGITGVANGGSTIHSYLGLGFIEDTPEIMTMNIMKRPKIKKRWLSIDILIIDEISMMCADKFDKVEAVARLIRGCSLPFGGIQLVITGDLYQLPPVKNEYFCFEAKSWNKCIKKTIFLSEIIRQKDISFQNCLNKVRIGEIDEYVKNMLNSRIGIKLRNNNGIQPTQIFTTNGSVDYINTRELEKLIRINNLQPYSYDMVFEEFDQPVNSKFKEKCAKDCIASTTLQLCVGAQVMLLQNIDLDNDLANGSRGVVIDFVGDSEEYLVPVVRFMNGDERVIDFSFWDYKDGDEVVLRILQIPLKLAWAVTVHKCQGMTLDYAIIDLTFIFAYGQGYVALSRVKRLDGLSLKGIDYDLIRPHPKVIQFYKEIQESNMKSLEQAPANSLLTQKKK